MKCLFEVYVPTTGESRLFQEIAIKYDYSIAHSNEVLDIDYPYIQIWDDHSMSRDHVHFMPVPSTPTKDAIEYFISGKLPFVNKYVTLGTYKAELRHDGSLKVGCQTISKDQIDNLLNAMNGKTFVPWIEGDEIPF